MRSEFSIHSANYSGTVKNAVTDSENLLSIQHTTLLIHN